METKPIKKGNKILATAVVSAVPEIDRDTPRPYMLKAKEYIPLGTDNLFLEHVARLNRRTAVNRGILKSKVRYITGDGFNYDDKNVALKEFVEEANAEGETLRAVIKKLSNDKQTFGNAYIQIITDANRSFLNIAHVDATMCRLGSDLKSIIVHPDWANYDASREEAVTFAKWPRIEKDPEDGQYRSMLQIKEYEPTFTHYGVMSWVAGLEIGAIAYKTDRWNISRLDNSYKSSGLLIIDGDFDDEEEAEEIKELYEKEFTGEGKTGKVMVIVKEPGQDKEGTKFVPIEQNDEGDWTKLHAQATSDLVIAHSWFRSLTGVETANGFDTQRILNEYQTALNTVILDEQNLLLEILLKLMSEIGNIKVKVDELNFINRPPVKEKPSYMKVWEARKADGLEYDENDPAQQIYLAELTKNNTNGNANNNT